MHLCNYVHMYTCLYTHLFLIELLYMYIDRPTHIFVLKREEIIYRKIEKQIEKDTCQYVVNLKFFDQLSISGIISLEFSPFRFAFHLIKVSRRY